MTVLAVTEDEGWEAPVLDAALRGVPSGAPVVILIHGFRYAPGVAGHDPHDLILSPEQVPASRRVLSWPRHLGLTGRSGLAIGFGWQGRGDIWQAYRRSAVAGVALAEMIGRLRVLAPERPVHIVAHSLGARVALAALPHCAPGAVDRMILMAGAAFRGEARAAMASPAGRTAQVLHVRGAENALFEALLRLAFPLAGRTLGAGLPGVAGWVDLALDRPECTAALARMGHRIGPPVMRICHWSGYTRSGVFGLYRAVLAGRTGFDALRSVARAGTVPESGAAPGWLSQATALLAVSSRRTKV